MTGCLVVIAGTGTEIGKTHVTEAILLALEAAGARAAGLKPIESGVGGEDAGSDASRLRRASTFHVKPFGVALRAPVSPHRAARAEGVTLDLEDLAAKVHAAVPGGDLLLVELPGGLFTPLAEHTVNADFVALLRPDVLLLVAPDRLGVLHDVLAATRAAQAASLGVHGIVLVTPERPDASTGSNAADLAAYSAIPVLATVPRAPPALLAADPSVALIVAAIRR
jgi:dethiobiotin synthetase